MNRAVFPGRFPVFWCAVLLQAAAHFGYGLPGTPARASAAWPWTAEERADSLARVDSLRVHYHADEAAALTERLLGSFRGDSAFVLQLLLRRGELLVVAGQGAPAELTLRRALRLAEAAPDSAASCSALRWLSLALESQGRTEESARMQRDLLSLSRRCGNRLYEAWALVGLAWRDQASGRPDESLEKLGRAIPLFEETGERRGKAWALNGLGVSLTGEGRWDEARAAFTESGELAGRIGDRIVECFAWNNLGEMEFSLGDPGRALDLFRRSTGMHARVGNTREAVIPAVNVAVCQASLGRLRAAAGTLDSLLSLCRRERYRDYEAVVLNHLARVRRDQGRTAEARALYRRVLSLGEGLPLKTRFDARCDLARCLASADSADAAVRLLEEGSHALAPLPGSEIRAGLDGCLARQYLAAGRARDALRTLGRARREAADLGARRLLLPALTTSALACRALGRPDSAAGFFREAVGLWQEDRAVPLDPEWREERSAAGKLLASEYADLLLGGEGEVREPSRVASAYDAIQLFRARTLLERMRGPRGAKAERADSPPALATCGSLRREVLREDELLLEFLLGPRVSLLLAVRREECRAVRLCGEDSLAVFVRRYRELLSRDSRGEVPAPALEVIAGSVARRVFGGVEDLIAASGSILVVPDGCLNLLPFTELPFPSPEASRPSSDAPGGHCGDRTWVRIPSATILALLRGAPEPGARCSVLALASPHNGTGEALSGALHEVRDLEWRYRGVDTHPGPAGSFDALVAGHNVLHLAGHARVDDESPWQSVILVPAPGGESELPAGRIAGARTPLRLAVLSSCESAAGRVLSGEGTLGLASAFLSAGSRAVVASLWPVDDRRTSGLMRELYRSLARGRTVAEALTEAQKTLRGDPATSHPYYWAGFVVLGDGRVRIPLEGRSHPEIYGAAGLFLLFALASVLMLRRDHLLRRDRPGGNSSV